MAAGGWTQCHKELYNNPLNDSQVEEIKKKCFGKRTFMACQRVGSDHLTLAAWGKQSTVFTSVTEEKLKCHPCKVKIEGGTKWYRTLGAWGFIAANSSYLYIRHCDFDIMEDGTRMCWFCNKHIGGYRCGANHRLNKSNVWERVIFHAN